MAAALYDLRHTFAAFALRDAHNRRQVDVGGRRMDVAAVPPNNEAAAETVS